MASELMFLRNQIPALKNTLNQVEMAYEITETENNKLKILLNEQ